MSPDKLQKERQERRYRDSRVQQHIIDLLRGGGLGGSGSEIESDGLADISEPVVAGNGIRRAHEYSVRRQPITSQGVQRIEFPPAA